jgi:Secretion system C-terminal sorting domain
MAFKITSFVFVISLVFSIPSSNQVQNVPFNANEIINRVSPNHSKIFKFPSRESDKGRFDQYLNSQLNGEFLVDTGLFCTSTPSADYEAAIAFDGTNYLVLWYDFRQTPQIYGTRVSQAGKILDPAGILINLTSPAGSSRFNPSVTFGSSNYFVVWDQPDSWDPYYDDIFGARVNRDGVVLDTDAIPIATVANSNQYNGDVSFDGTNYLVVWTDHRLLPGEVYGARVTQDGSVLDPDGFRITISHHEQAGPSAAFDGSNYLVVWSDKRNNDTFDIYGARITPAGTVIEPDGFPISTAPNEQSGASIVFDGINYFVVWQDFRNFYLTDTQRVDIYGARVTRSGTVLDMAGIAISTAPYNQGGPKAAFDDTNYLVVWDDYRKHIGIHHFPDIFGARVSRFGDVLDPNGIPICTTYATSEGSPAVAFDGSYYFTVWDDSRDPLGNIYGARINQSGIVLDTAGFWVSTETNWQENSAAAFDGANYLVVWQDWRVWMDSGIGIYGIRISSAGTALEPASIAISTGAGNREEPAVAFDGTNYLVVWSDERNGSNYDIYGTRLTQSGTILDPTGFVISTGEKDQFRPAIAFDGTNYLVVWMEGSRDTSYRWDLCATRVNQSGVVIDTTRIIISNTLYDQGYPKIAFDGTNYLVVWTDNSRRDIYGARINQDGVVLDPDGFIISAEPSTFQTYPSVAFDGSNYFVVWSDNRNGSCICGARVNQEGVIIDTIGIVISDIATDQTRTKPAVTFDGTNYLVVWEKRYSSADESRNIYGARVNTSGIVIDSFPVAVQKDQQQTPALAHDSGGQVLIAYSGWADYINSHPANTLRIWGKFYPFVGMDEDNPKVKIQSTKLLDIYPNPAKSFLAIRLPQTADRTEMKIFDVSGALIREIATTATQSSNDREAEMKISLKGINPGIYFLRLGKETKKFLVLK